MRSYKEALDDETKTTVERWEHAIYPPLYVLNDFAAGTLWLMGTQDREPSTVDAFALDLLGYAPAKHEIEIFNRQEGRFDLVAI